MLLQTHEILSVTHLTEKVKKTLSRSFDGLWVSGEISNISRPASGHLYFSLKDSNAQVRCAMFRSKNHSLNFEPKNGLQVLVYARLDLYTMRGDLQLIIETMEISGKGELKEQFEILKKKLAKEGIFDDSRKLPIPVFPRTIGIIASLKSAAIKDVLRILNNRSPSLNIIIYPTIVQGEQAPEHICRALQIAKRRNEVDTIILTRGGGSLEDLYAFNHEQVVQTIAASTIPIISGIGHDIDFTLADFAADLRASTPTAAAHAACPDEKELKQILTSKHTQIQKTILHYLNTCRQNTKLLNLHLTQHHPLSQIEYLMQRLDGLSENFVSITRNRKNQHRLALLSLWMRLKQNAPLIQIESYNNRIANIHLRLNMNIQNHLNNQNNLFKKLSVHLNSLNPLAVLKRGFSVTTTRHGKIVRDPRQTIQGNEIKVQVEKGSIRAIVKSIKPQ